MIFSFVMIIILISFVVVFSFLLNKHYTDPSEAYSFASITFALSLTLSLFCLLMIPIDVMATSNPSLYQDFNVQNTFLYLYYLMMIFTFFIIPFCYFYGEQRDDFDDSSLSQKITKALQQTIFFFLFIIICIVISFCFKYLKTNKNENQQDLMKKIFNSSQLNENILFLIISIITCIGTLFWVKYGAHGLGTLPVELIKGKKSLQETKKEINNDLANIREKYRNIQQKYSKSHVKISKSDQKLLNNLKKQEKYLSIKNEQISFVESNFGTFNQLVQNLAPFRVILGFICLTLSVVFCLSLSITTADKLMNSKCGINCGFIIEKPSFKNPIDFILVQLINFHIDQIFFFALMLYFFLACLYSLLKQGISLSFLKLYDIQKEQTMPQAFLFLSFIMNLSVLSIQSQLMTLIPQYTTFGAQAYLAVQGGKKPCSLDMIHIDGCNMSIVSQIFNKISVEQPIFGAFLFLSNFIFIIYFLFSLIFSSLKKKDNFLEVLSVQNQEDTNEVDLEIEEKQFLLK